MEGTGGYYGTGDYGTSFGTGNYGTGSYGSYSGTGTAWSERKLDQLVERVFGPLKKVIIYFGYIYIVIEFTVIYNFPVCHKLFALLIPCIKFPRCTPTIWQYLPSFPTIFSLV